MQYFVSWIKASEASRSRISTAVHASCRPDGKAVQVAVVAIGYRPLGSCDTAQVALASFQPRMSRQGSRDCDGTFGDNRRNLRAWIRLKGAN